MVSLSAFHRSGLGAGRLADRRIISEMFEL